MEELKDAFDVASAEQAVNAQGDISASDAAQNRAIEMDWSPEAQKSVLCINICNDVFHSVPVDCLNKDNKYSKFCFGRHVSSNSTKEAIPLVVYNNSDDQTLSLDDVTLANVLSKNPSPMTGPLFYRKSKAEFKELTENEIAKLVLKTSEMGALGSDGTVDGMPPATDKPINTVGAVFKSPGQPDLTPETNSMMEQVSSPPLTAQELVRKDHPYATTRTSSQSSVPMSSSQESAGYTEEPPSVEVDTFSSPRIIQGLNWCPEDFEPRSTTDSLNTSPNALEMPQTRRNEDDMNSTDLSQASTFKLWRSQEGRIEKGFSGFQSSPGTSPSKTSVLPASSDTLGATMKKRAQGWVGGLPSPHVGGGAASPAKQANGKPQQNLTEAMLDEKMLAELPDDDYKFSSEDTEDPWPGSDNAKRRSVKKEYIDTQEIFDMVEAAHPGTTRRQKRRRSTPARRVPPDRDTEEECSPKKTVKKVSTKMAAQMRRLALNKELKKPANVAPTVKAVADKVPSVDANSATGSDDKSSPTTSSNSRPKRENRRLPSRLQDALQPALFSTPDVIRRISTDRKNALSADSIERILMDSPESEPQSSQSIQVYDNMGGMYGASDDGITSKDSGSDPLVIVEGDKSDTGDEHMDQESPVVKQEVKVSKRIRKKKRNSFSEEQDFDFAKLPEHGEKVSRADMAKPKSSEKGKKAKGSRVNTKPVEEADSSGMDSESSMNSEDDPNKLWCICRKPHNNRFMICCDSCEDWFHGICVNITKAMGKAMETAGQEWTCPSCVDLVKKPTVEIAKESLKTPSKKSPGAPSGGSAGKQPVKRRAQNLLGSLSKKKAKVATPKSKVPEKRCGF